MKSTREIFKTKTIPSGRTRGAATYGLLRGLAR